MVNDIKELEKAVKTGSLPCFRFTWPHGSIIEIGEAMMPEGPAPYISLAATGRPSSLVFYVDPISFQPMMRIKTSVGSRILPIDKIVRNPLYEDVDSTKSEDLAELDRLRKIVNGTWRGFFLGIWDRIRGRKYL